MSNDIDQIVEWAVWANLDTKTDLELILLKGHLLLEFILDIKLERSNILDYKEYSFYRKILNLKNIDFEDNVKKDYIISCLQTINKIRNKLAHELHFNIGNGELEIWSSNILVKFKGEKFTKYTFRTKIVHSFSILSKNILELK